MNSKKKLVIFMPSIEGGGVEKNFFIISNFLAKKLENITVITADKSYKKYFNKKIELIMPKSNYWHNKGRKIKYCICLFLLFLYYLKNKNFLVFSFQANIYAILFSKIFGLKIISRSNSSSTGWSKNYLKNIIFKILLRSANKVIVNSYEFKNELDKKFGIKSVCIYNPFNKLETIRLSKTKNNYQFFNKDKKTLKVINVGRLTDQKDHLTLLKAIRIIGKKIQIKLLIIGRGVNKKKLENYIKINNLQKKIRLMDFQKNPLKFIRLADIFILSSKYEGLPNVLLEALSLKKFVISSNCPTGPNEILSSNKGGLLFKMGDESDLAKKIIFYSKYKKKLSSKTRYGYKQLFRFDYNKNLNKYLKVVENYL